MRKFIVRQEHENMGVGPYVAAEIVVGWFAEALEDSHYTDEFLTAAELQDRYPGTLDAWRRGDDSTADQDNELDELDEMLQDGEADEIQSSPKVWDAELAKCQEMIVRAGPALAHMSAEAMMEFSYGPRPPD
jgi:hypothetical protein